MCQRRLRDAVARRRCSPNLPSDPRSTPNTQTRRTIPTDQMHTLRVAIPPRRGQSLHQWRKRRPRVIPGGMTIHMGLMRILPEATRLLLLMLPSPRPPLLRSPAAWLILGSMQILIHMDRMLTRREGIPQRAVNPQPRRSPKPHQLHRLDARLHSLVTFRMTILTGRMRILRVVIHPQQLPRPLSTIGERRDARVPPLWAQIQCHPVRQAH